MAAPKRRLPAPLYDIGKKIRTRGMDPQEIAWEDYLIPGLDQEVLRNKVGTKNEPYGCTDRDTLIAREERFTAFRMIEQRRKPIQGDFDFAHMRAIHRDLFQDVYEWAGEPRNVDMVKEGHEYLSHGHVATMWNALDEALARNDYFRGISDQAEFVDKFAAQWGMVNATHAFREGNTRSQVMFFAGLAEQAGWRLDVTRLDPDHPESIRDEFIEARFFHQDNGFDSSRLATVLTKAISPVELQLEREMQRAATPSADHERWAPRPPGQPDLMRRTITRQTLVAESDEYSQPDKMRTSHRRIATEEPALPIDPSRNSRPIPQMPTGDAEETRTLVDGRPRSGMSTQRGADEPSVIDQFTDEDGYEDTRSIELLADLEADMAEESARITREAAQEERYRRFPELRPVPMPHKPGSGRHRAADTAPEL